MSVADKLKDNILDLVLSKAFCQDFEEFADIV